MTYDRIVKGKFLSRPNRFIAYVEVDGNEEICHVKNTGRCKELLVPGAHVFVQLSDNPSRKTKYDLISVFKGDMLVNMDSQAPNKVFGEWAVNSGFFKDITFLKPECKYKNSRFDFYIEADSKKIFVEVKGVTLENDGVVSFPDAPTERGVKHIKDITFLKPECKYKNSRFDFYIEADSKKIFVEVKGVTLENDGIVSFPDAPTERGVKHIKELIEAVKDGYEAYVFFIIQMDNCKYFTPAVDKHPEFAKALKEASQNGVNVVALNCKVTPSTLVAKDFVDVSL